MMSCSVHNARREAFLKTQQEADALRLQKICVEDGCPEIAQVSGRCSTHARRSPSSRATSRPGWRSVRASVLVRDGSVCQLALPGCTRQATTVDHVRPAAMGGSNDPDNLRAACAPCNRKQGANGY
jgi:5-methylcytosine-specific restriction endonuclease McrA